MLSASGLLGVTVPRAYGGADVSFETIAKILQLISAADPAIGQLTQKHFLFADAIRQNGTIEQQQLFFSELLAGARFGNAQSENGTSSALDLRTRLLPEPAGGYRLDGARANCTGAHLAHWIPVAALDDEERLALAYVPRDAKGVRILDDWNGMGQRVTLSGTVIFEDVFVSELHVVEHWRLFERPSLFHAFASLLHAAIDVALRKMRSTTHWRWSASASDHASVPVCKAPARIHCCF